MPLLLEGVMCAEHDYSSPTIDHDSGLIQAVERRLIQAFLILPIQACDEGVLDRFAWMGDLQLHVATMRTFVQARLESSGHG
ncbi:hypothetical protein VA599_00975 [Chromobacterium sp. TRC.1.1.SA]|uniref:Uncharacterized protein n=1 Tax=Chromobacterium indicum TaxID=3110228 RepID=A0ABV0CDL5_9NEIS